MGKLQHELNVHNSLLSYKKELIKNDRVGAGFWMLPNVTILAKKTGASSTPHLRTELVHTMPDARPTDLPVYPSGSTITLHYIFRGGC